MLTVIQYYIIIKIKKTKTSRKDLKKEGIMRINSYNKFFVEVAKIMNTSVKAVKQLDGRYKVELANHVYLNVYRGVSGSLFIHDHRGIAHITSCYDFDDFKTMKDLYERLITDDSESTNAETVTQPSEESIKDTIIADDNITYQTAKVTKTKHSVLEVMQCMMCPADREGNRCGGKQWCKQTRKRYDAIVNPEWHHVSLATLANIDFDMLDEKRKLVCNINQILKDGIRNLYKCENHISSEVLERYVIRKCDELIRHNRLKAFWFSYIARQLDEVRRNTIYLYSPYITAHRNR